MEAPQTSRRRATSVVTSQFLRHDPLPWNIKVNFDAATVTPKPTVRSQTLLLSHGVHPTVEGAGRPRTVSTTTASQPFKVTKSSKRVSVSQRWWAARRDGTQSKVRYIFGPSPEHKGSDVPPSPMGKGAGSKNRRASTFTMRTRRIRKRFMLPIVIQGHSGPSKILAFPDTGSDHNIVSLEVLRQLGLDMEDVDSESSPRFSVANGKIVQAISQITIKFGFAGVLPQEESTSSGLFFVFSQLAVPTIIGRSLLEQTQTFTKHRHRLIQEIVPSLQCLSLTSITEPRRDLCCRLNGNVSYATADTGSDLDLVSPEFAEAKGFTIDPAFEKVQFADGSYGVTCGVIPSSTFSIGSQMDDGGFFVQKGQAIQRDFYVLESLTSEILVGLDTLEKLKVYDSYQESLVHRMSVLSFADANVVRYIGSLEYLTREALKKMKKKKEKEALTNSTVEDPSSRRDILFADQRENARREVVKLTIANLTGDARTAAQEEEEKRIKAYEEERQRRIEPRIIKDTVSVAGKTVTTLSSLSSSSDSIQKPKVGGMEAFYCNQSDCHFSWGGRPFRAREDLALHERLHDSEGYVCPLCPRDKEIRFDSNPAIGPRLLTQHVLSEHPDVDPNEPLLQQIFNPLLVSNGIGRDRSRRQNPLSNE